MTRSISAWPRALKRFTRAMRMWMSAVWRSGSRDAILALTDLRPRRFSATGSSEPARASSPRSDSGVIARPMLPGRPPEASGRPGDFVARRCGRAVLLPKAPVLADEYKGGAATREDRGVAAAGVESPIAGHRADRLIRRDLAEQVRKDGSVAFAARGEFLGPDVAGGRVNRQMYLAVVASAMGAMLAGQPFAVARELGPPLPVRSNRWRLPARCRP